MHSEKRARAAKAVVQSAQAPMPPRPIIITPVFEESFAKIRCDRITPSIQRMTKEFIDLATAAVQHSSGPRWIDMAVLLGRQYERLDGHYENEQLAKACDALREAQDFVLQDCVREWEPRIVDVLSLIALAKERWLESYLAAVKEAIKYDRAIPEWTVDAAPA